MKRPERKLTAKETLDLLSQQWATTDDIQKLAYVGDSKLREITNNLKEIIQKRGYKLPKRLYPMNLVQEYLGININYLKKIEREEV